MSDTPNYYPPFLQDFHDQKDFFKAFYTWLTMMDNQREDKERKSHMGLLVSKMPRRDEMCNWSDFHVLVISMIQFLDTAGYRVYKKKGVETDTNAIISDLKTLPLIWDAIRYPDEIVCRMREEYWRPIMERWKGWWDLMPKDVIAKLKEKNSVQISNQGIMGAMTAEEIKREYEVVSV